MAVQVRIPSVLLELVGGARTVQVEGDTIRRVLDDLEKRYPGIKQRLMTDGKLHEFVNIYLNNEDVRFLKEMETPVADGDSVAILPAIAGGSD